MLLSLSARQHEISARLFTRIIPSTQGMASSLYLSTNQHAISASLSAPIKIPKCTNVPSTLTNFPTRRQALSAIVLSLPCFLLNPGSGSCLEFKLVAPDLTLEEAQARARIHAQELVQLKYLIQMESWKEAQKSLRSSSSRLRQEIYTIIQSMPGDKRPQLRKLYSDLFNSVTRLDYAARSKDAEQVRECYNRIVMALIDIYSIIQ